MPCFQRARICVWKLEMIDSRYSSSSGMGFSSAIFKCSSGRRMLINAVVKLVRGSRSMASNTGRKKGSNRRSRCTKEIDAFASQFRNADPVLAGGTGRLAFEFMAEIDQDSCGD